MTSGANIKCDRMRLVAELAGIGAFKEAMQTITMPNIVAVRGCRIAALTSQFCPAGRVSCRCDERCQHEL